MTADDIIARVVSKIQDSAFTEAAILDLINDGRFHIATIIDLPSLRTSDTLVATSTENSVELPDDYHKGIFWVWSTTQNRRIGKRLGDYYNILTFLETYPGQTGRIDAVCVDGPDLLYQGAADDGLIIRYYKKPAVISDTDDSPEELPYQFQQRALEAYCCKEIFADIEDGMEGQKVNTDFWAKKFDRIMAELTAFVELNKPREAKYVRDVTV